MRFHVISLPHTQATEAFNACAFTNKVRLFCRMMKDRGHTVFLYAGEETDAPCDELITCTTEEERAAHVGNGHYSTASFDVTLPFWMNFNARVERGIRQRAHKTDFICVIGGRAHKPIADAFPDMLTVEFGVGYGGWFSNYKVFESYAWMHTCYGATTMGNPNAADGNWWDVVIPGYLEPERFPFRAEKDDYFLFVGRLIDRKGFQIAADVCRDLGKQLVVAGAGTPPKGCKYVGVVGIDERNRLMAGARAVFVPTIYVEPFGNVNIEAQACGTPVITTDWGAFAETVIEGETGFRCRTFGEFSRAAEKVQFLNPARIRQHAVETYGIDVIGAQYEAYFERLSHLWGAGWYEGREARVEAA